MSDPAPPRFATDATPDEKREFEPFVHELIGTAFGVIAQHFLRGTAVMQKHDATPVTLADRGAEEAMRALIERRYPRHAIVGEELGRKDGQRYRWILDPVDGTRAFITNCFLFGTLIALERDDGEGFRPLLGAIAHPAAGLALMGTSSGTTLYARDGSARPARVRPCERLDAATLLASSHWECGEQSATPGFGALIQRVRMYRTWGDCFGYFALATGGADIMVDGALAYWDAAAIVPVVEGAGGRVSSVAGADPLRTQPHSLVATAGAIHDDVVRLLAPPPG
ncbi:MAG TPA: inositol monophosphatase family protein [Burkholderiaceae bacterium]|nr:inositol monophosphatase family protein [Burkholderiaceae bacterium]